MENRLADLRKKLILKTQDQLKEHYSGRDVHIVRAISALDDLDEIFNLMAEHIKEWYSAHFPELFRIVKEPENELKLIYELGARENFSAEKIIEFYKNEEKSKDLESAAKKSVGAETLEQDIAEMKLLALNALNIHEEREYLSKYIEKTMTEMCPNFSEICGAVLGARILAKAGSLKNLAFMPASTVQIIGAEKALFQAKKAGSKRTPKHGLIYQHPLLRTAKAGQKGRIARALAGKLSIAARRDYFSKEDFTKELKLDLEKRIAEISKSKPRKKDFQKPEQRADDSDYPKREVSSYPRSDSSAYPRRDKPAYQRSDRPMFPRRDDRTYPRREGSSYPRKEGSNFHRRDGASYPKHEGPNYTKNTDSHFRPKKSFGSGAPASAGFGNKKPFPAKKFPGRKFKEKNKSGG